MLLLYTVCVVKQGQSLYNGVLLLFFKIQYKKVEKKKNKRDVSGSIKCGETKASGIFCVVKLNFYFHIHLWFFASIETRQ